MPSRSKSHTSDFISRTALALLALSTLCARSAPATAAEKVEKTITKGASQSKLSIEMPNHGITEWTKHRSATSRAWNRAALRPEPAPATPSTNLNTVPTIRQINANGSEDGEATTAVAPEAAGGHSAPAESHDSSPTSSPTSSLSVREQLLNALRKQRETTVDASPSLRRGSLTIMNSPAAPPHRAGAHPHDPPIEISGETPVERAITVHSESSFLKSAGDAAKSHIGLTRTLETDIQSTDPYVRDRAQRYLRLQMQLLKLRASQAATAEQTTPNAGSHTPEAAAGHVLGPSHDVVSPRQSADPREIPDEHAASHSPADPIDSEVQPDEHGQHRAEESESAHPQDVAPVQSPHTSMIENIVVDGPIDRLGLANNLFATGQYPLSLEMYKQTAATELTAQQHFWVEYQTANCLRRLGKSTEAAQLYRRLADHPEAGWLSQQARWWVETLEKIRSLEQVLANNAFDQHRTAIEELENATQPIQNPPVAPAPSPSLNKESAHDAPAH